MNTRHDEIATLIMDLEASLRNLGLWSEQRPSAEALASQQPFCVDTLEFQQWLQFVFIERISILVERRLPLPNNSGLAPMAEEYFRGTPYSPENLIETLRTIDRTLSEG
ncbi:YqcC family protein [Gilvimarinus sp. F26214L]|uniref:YqcC family protein n=1 Tax=Gilvimarinus sp. DZF01 TaxID=3461371 RepID=UPI00404682A4